MYASVDEVVHKMEAQLKKYKSRIKDKDQKKVAETKMPRAAGAAGAEEEAEASLE
jgi:ribosome-associated translation inhibitor RaiA